MGIPVQDQSQPESDLFSVPRPDLVRQRLRQNQQERSFLRQLLDLSKKYHPDDADPAGPKERPGA